MRAVTIKIVNLLALLGAVAWLVWSPGWEPLVTSLALFGSLIAQEVAPVLKQKGKDAILLDKFLEEFPSNGKSVTFLKEQDIGAPFHSDDLNEIANFVRTWDNVEHEFLNKKLEAQRQKLLKLTIDFRKELSLNIFSDPGRFFTMDIRGWEDRPEKLKKREELNRMASVVYREHQELVRIGRKLT